MDDFHFVSAKKKAQFKIKTQVGPFICNNRAASTEADTLLKEINFQLSFTWSYDPFGIISSLRVEQNTTPYSHTPMPKIEKFMKKYQWEENNLQEVQEQILSTTTSQTPVPQEKRDKRPIEEDYSLVTEIEAKQFLIYTKKPKNNPPPFFMQDEEGQTTMVMLGKHVSTTPKDIFLGTRQEELFIGSPYSSASQDPPDVAQTTNLAQGQTQPKKISKYKAIKQKNEMLKSSSYKQFWKQTATSQHRLFSSFDIEQGRIQMAFLQEQAPFPKSPENYKNTIFSFDTNQFHLIDQMEMHKQTGEMFYSTLNDTTMTASKLQTSINNIQSQLKLEKISALEKDTRIKLLNYLVVKLGYDPSDVKVVEEILKKKNVDIAALRKQLKMPSTEDPQTKEMGELEKKRKTCSI